MEGTERGENQRVKIDRESFSAGVGGERGGWEGWYREKNNLQKEPKPSYSECRHNE